MKRISMLFSLVLPFIMTIVALQAGGSKVFARDNDIVINVSCQHCGMDREKFAHSRMLIEFEDGTSVATCSLHCVAVDLASNIDKAPRSIRVADYATKHLIDAETAHWIIGGNKQGVMTRNAKWAFADKGKAETFLKENGGGKLSSFDEAIRAAYEDMYADIKMIRDKRKQMRMNREGRLHGSDMKGR